MRYCQVRLAFAKMDFTDFRTTASPVIECAQLALDPAPRPARNALWWRALLLTALPARPLVPLVSAQPPHNAFLAAARPLSSQAPASA